MQLKINVIAACYCFFLIDDGYKRYNIFNDKILHFLLLQGAEGQTGRQA